MRLYLDEVVCLSVLSELIPRQKNDTTAQSMAPNRPMVLIDGERGEQ